MNIIVAVAYDIEIYLIECYSSLHQVYFSLKICMNYPTYPENHHNLGDEGHEYDLARNEVSF